MNRDSEAVRRFHEIAHYFDGFKRSADRAATVQTFQTLREQAFAINKTEEDADRPFVGAMRTLHTTFDDPMQVPAWHEVYAHLERRTDDCEHVANEVHSVAMKND